MPAGERTALNGRWVRGPGRALFDAIDRSLGAGLPLVAEDLGVITPPVNRLRDELGLPGMLVLQLGFDPAEPDSPHRPANHVVNRVVYTGTHDNDTARGWLEGLDAGVRARWSTRRCAPFGERQPWWGLIRLAFSSPARVAIVQAQDVLGLGSRARMNDPGHAGGNWRWQMERGALTKALARRLRAIADEAGRLPSR